MTVERLWVPFTHSQRALHWNFAASGASVSAWRAPRRASILTPLSTMGASVWVIFRSSRSVCGGGLSPLAPLSGLPPARHEDGVVIC